MQSGSKWRLLYVSFLTVSGAKSHLQYGVTAIVTRGERFYLFIYLLEGKQMSQKAGKTAIFGYHSLNVYMT